MSNKKITYLLGAGASYQACPILSELGDKMIEMSKSKLGNTYKLDFDIKRDFTRNNSQDILQLIGYFGRKSIEYGTIDTYAKKLSLSPNYSLELKSLKMAVSMFFTIWEATNDPIKNRLANKENIPYKNIDLRYISLLATFLELSKIYIPILNENIKFVTWNYDLQVEKAYKSFLHEHLNRNMLEVDDFFRFQNKNIENGSELNIVHLNGYSGFIYSQNSSDKKQEVCFYDFSDSTDFEEIIKSFNNVYNHLNLGLAQLNDHINYAWEQTELANKKRKYAKKIFSESDAIVVIGYSFPPFNRQVDKMMFDALKGRKTKVYYQDPNASESVIKNFVDNDCDVIVYKDKMEHFVVPDEF